MFGSLTSRRILANNIWQISLNRIWYEEYDMENLKKSDYSKNTLKYKSFSNHMTFMVLVLENFGLHQRVLKWSWIDYCNHSIILCSLVVKTSNHTSNINWNVFVYSDVQVCVCCDVIIVISWPLIAIKIDINFNMCSVKMTETSIKSCYMAITNQLNDSPCGKGSNIILFFRPLALKVNPINTRNGTYK